MSGTKITYYDCGGRSEVLRIVMHFNGMSWEEEYVDGKWPEMKKALTDAGKLAFGQVPLLEHEGRCYVQSMSMLRYLGRKFDLMGKDAEEEYRVNMIVDGTIDVREPYYCDAVGEGEEDTIRFAKTRLPPFLENFERIKKASPGNFCVGDSLTIADVALFDILHIFVCRVPDVLAPFPSLKAFHDAFIAQPKYQAYTKSAHYHTM